VLLHRRWPRAWGLPCPQVACRTCDKNGSEKSQLRAGCMTAAGSCCIADGHGPRVSHVLRAPAEQRRSVGWRKAAASAADMAAATSLSGAAASQMATGLESFMSSGRLQNSGQVWVRERTTEGRLSGLLLRLRWPGALGLSCAQGACRTADKCGSEKGQMRAC
jgi:hypothetical protein